MPLLRKNPFGLCGHLDDCLLFNYAVPSAQLRPFIPSFFELESYAGYGFFNVVALTMSEIRPDGLPAFLGVHHAHLSYRIIVRLPLIDGQILRGLYVVRSDVDGEVHNLLGNLFTSFQFNCSYVRINRLNSNLRVEVQPASGIRAAVQATVDIAQTYEALPGPSQFRSVEDARMFLAALPNAFDYDAARNEINVISMAREEWDYRVVRAQASNFEFFESGEHFTAASTRPDLIFHVSHVPYHWMHWRVVPLSQVALPSTSSALQTTLASSSSPVLNQRNLLSRHHALPLRFFPFFP